MIGRSLCAAFSIFGGYGLVAGVVFFLEVENVSDAIGCESQNVSTVVTSAFYELYGNVSKYFTVNPGDIEYTRMRHSMCVPSFLLITTVLQI